MFQSFANTQHTADEGSSHGYATADISCLAARVPGIWVQLHSWIVVSWAGDWAHKCLQ